MKTYESHDAGRLVVFAFLVEAVLAGGNSVAIRFSNRELGPLWGAGLRFLTAALLIAVVTRYLLGAVNERNYG